MMRILHFVCLGLGIALVGATWLVYENEEKQIQSKLENLWIHLSDYGSQMIAHHSAASSRVIGVLGALIDHIFGSKILSLRFLAASISISSAGILISPITFGLGATHHKRTLVIMTVVIGELLIFSCFWFGVLKKKLYLFGCIASLIICISGMALAICVDTKDTQYDLGFFIVPTLCALPASIFADAVTLWAIGRMRKWASAAKGFRAVAVTLGIAFVAPLVMVMSVVAVISPAFLFHDNLSGAGFMVVGLWDALSMNAANILLFFLLGMIAVGLAIHSAIWPFILRPLYSLQREGWGKTSKDIRKVGFALIAFGLAFHPAILHFFSKVGGFLGL
jgi:hypothetical protein